MRTILSIIGRIAGATLLALSLLAIAAAPGFLSDSSSTALLNSAKEARR
jgi:hypothetical protein